MDVEEFICRVIDAGYRKRYEFHDMSDLTLRSILWSLEAFKRHGMATRIEECPEEDWGTFEYIGAEFNITHRVMDEMDQVTCSMIDEKATTIATLVLSRQNGGILTHWVDKEHEDSDFSLLRISTNYRQKI